jgi:thiamine biosynthesis protein ThiI
VLRPLIGFDKSEIIERAQRIGTFTLSIENEPDCCTVFQPEHPVIHGRRAECVAAEAGLDVDGLVTRSFEARRTLEIEA